MKLCLMDGAEEMVPLFSGDFEFVYIQSEEDLHHIDKSSIILFSGGEDIATSIYNQKPSKYCYNELPTPRDQLEIAAFKKGQEVGAKNFGICRGSQLLCALSGGALYQHVTDHGRNHVMRIRDTTMIVNSTHHQMWDLRPLKKGIDYILIGHAQEQAQYVFNYKESRMQIYNNVDPEIAWFKKTKSLAIQGHPEYLDAPAAYVNITKQLISTYLINSLIHKD